MSVTQKLASILPHITGLCLSTIGNTCIIIDVVSKYYYRKHPTNNHHRPNTYHRLMLGLSVTSMFASVANGLSTWPMPASSGAWQAFGTEGTCKAQAFFLQIGIGGPFYICALAIYYYLFIVKNLSSRHILRVERYMHPVCLLFGLSTAISGLVLDVFGPASFWCWVTGDHVILQWIFWHGPLWSIAVIVSVLMAVVYFNLRRQYKNQQRWAQQYATAEPVAADATRRKTKAGSLLGFRCSSWTVKSNEMQQTTSNRITRLSANTGSGIERNSNSNSISAHFSTRRTAAIPKSSSTINAMTTVATTRSSSSHEIFKWQSMYYLGAFYLTWIFLTITRAMQAVMNRQVPFWIALLAATFAPAGGFFNAIVYFRPKWIHQRKHHPEVGRFRTLIAVAFPFLGCKLSLGRPSLDCLSLRRICCCLRVSSSSSSSEKTSREIEVNEDINGEDDDDEEASGGTPPPREAFYLYNPAVP